MSIAVVRIALAIVSRYRHDAPSIAKVVRQMSRRAAARDTRQPSRRAARDAGARSELDEPVASRMSTSLTL